MADNQDKFDIHGAEEFRRATSAIGSNLSQVSDYTQKILKGLQQSKKWNGELVTIQEVQKKLAEAKVRIQANYNKSIESGENKLAKEKLKIDKQFQKSMDSRVKELIKEGKITQEQADDKQFMKRFDDEKLKSMRQQYGQDQVTWKQKKEAFKAEKAALHEQKQIDLDIIKLETQQAKVAAERAKRNQEAWEELEPAIDAFGEKVDETAGLVKNLPGGSLISAMLGTDDIAKKAKAKFNKHLEEQVKSGKLTVEQAQSRNASLLKTVMIVGLIADGLWEMFEAAMEMDQEVTDMTRALGTTKDEANHLHHEFIAISVASSDALMNTKNLSEAAVDLNEAFGMAAASSEEMLKSQVMLTKHMGLTSDEAIDMQKIAAGTGQTMEQLTSEIGLQVQEYNKATGANLKGKKVMQDIMKVSKNTRAYFSGNTKELVRQVATAKLLGTTLDEMNNQSDALLDIESSLESEMEARVMIGKDINLDKARELALNNDLAGAATEVLKQTGGLAEFNKMNRFQKEAMAKAAGVELGALQDQLQTAEMQRKLGVDFSKASKADLAAAMDKAKILANAGDEQAKQWLEQQEANSQQEKFNESIAELKEIFVSIMVPVTAIAGVIAGIVDYVTQIIGAFTLGEGHLSGWQVAVGAIAAGVAAIYGTMKGIEITQGIINAYKKSELLLSMRQAIIEKGGLMTLIGEAAMRVISSLASIPIVGWALGLAAAGTVAAIGYKYMSDGAMGPDGKILYSGKEGAIKLHDNDSVIAGTDLFGGNDKKESPTSVSVDMPEMETKSSPASTSVDTSRLESLMQQQNQLITQLLALINQPVLLKMNDGVVTQLSNAISLKKNMVAGMENTYGNTVG